LRRTTSRTPKGLLLGWARGVRKKCETWRGKPHFPPDRGEKGKGSVPKRKEGGGAQDIRGQKVLALMAGEEKSNRHSRKEGEPSSFQRISGISERQGGGGGGGGGVH